MRIIDVFLVFGSHQINQTHRVVLYSLGLMSVQDKISQIITPTDSGNELMDLRSDNKTQFYHWVYVPGTMLSATELIEM